MFDRRCYFELRLNLSSVRFGWDGYFVPAGYFVDRCTFVIIDMIQRVVFDEMKLRESRGFKRLWAIDVSSEDLPLQRRCDQFEWVKKSS
jgi:hypothetical protein